MISLTYNETNKIIEVDVDCKGIDLLIDTLQKLKSDGDHLHLYATNDDRGLATRSPYGGKHVYTGLVLNLLPTEAWRGSSID